MWEALAGVCGNRTGIYFRARREQRPKIQGNNDNFGFKGTEETILISGMILFISAEQGNRYSPLKGFEGLFRIRLLSSIKCSILNNFERP